MTLAPDHTVPAVSVNLWYRVGSAHEPEGRTGFAHLFEHMLFQGSENVGASEHFELIQRAGGTLNGSTWLDRTNYYETVPAHYLELALWLEADRMGRLLPAMTQEKLDTQRDVVKNERRWSVDNQPYGTWWERLPALAYPKGHPFHHSLIGSFEDLDAATLDDVRAFFALHYTPDNAVLSIVGDIEPNNARTLVERYFGGIPRGSGPPPLPPMDVPASLGAAREVVADDVAACRIFVAFRIPTFGTKEAITAAVCAAFLGGRRGSVLHQKLVRDLTLATEVSSFTLDLPVGADLLVIDVTAHPGIPSETLEAAVAAELRRVLERGVEERAIERAVAVAENEFVVALESSEGRADALSKFATYLGDPRLALDYTAQLRRVTRDDMNAFLRRYLQPTQQVSLLYIPRDPEPLGAA
ncbi:MAG: M16 family metallopeptidase [Gemmatimonadaceae bacterium]